MNKGTKITTLFCTFALMVSSVLSPASVAVQTKAKKPALSKKKITLKIGKTAKLKVNRAKGWKTTWKSKKKKLVTVKKSGKYAAKVTAKKKGTAKVVATVKKGKKRYNLTCIVKVVPANTTTNTSVTDNKERTNTSAAPTAQTQGNTNIASATPTVVPTDATSGTQTETPTSTPINTASVTPTENQTDKPTQTPAGTATATAKATASATAAATAKATASATVAATAKATASATVAATAKATATPKVPDQSNANAVLGSTVKQPTDASITASVGEAGAVAQFNASSQFKEVKFLLASPVSLQTVEKVEFTLSVEGTPNSVSFKLYDSDGSELKMTQYNKATGTHSITVPAECKGKTVAQYAIMTNSDIKDTTQTATATLRKLSFISSSGEPVVIPTSTPAATQTPVPAVTPAPEDEKMTLSADTFLTSAATEGNPVYNEDGSVTVTLKSDSGGGGIAFYFNKSKTPVDLSNYTKVIYTLSANTEVPLQINAYRSTNFWEGDDAKKAILLSYGGATTEKKEYSYELTNLGSVLGFGVRYNAWQSDAAKKVTVTIHSITFVKDERNIEDAITNYSSLAELALAKYGLKMGTVMNDRKVKDQKYADLMKYHFNSITAANEMKAYSMLNESASKEAAKSDPNAMPVLRFDSADAIMDFAKANGIKVRGHVLVWDADMCEWFFKEGYDSSKGFASKEVIKARVKNYIEQVLTHFEEKYPGVIYCWDVVNEAVGDTGPKPEENIIGEYLADDPRHVRTKRGEKTNLFYDRIGSDYVELSFLYTYETIQKLKGTYPSLEKIKLYYNDYSTFYATKRDAICELVKSINSYKKDENGKNVKLCDGVGMQSYIGGFGKQDGCMNDGDIDLVKAAILKFASLDIEVQVTELAVRNYQSDAETMAKHGEFYKKLFQAYLDLNSGTEKPLKAVSIWGIVDIPDLAKTDYSYRMNGPFCGLFDESLGVKSSFVNIHNLMRNGQ